MQNILTMNAENVRSKKWRWQINLIPIPFIFLIMNAFEKLSVAPGRLNLIYRSASYRKYSSRAVCMHCRAW